MGMKCDELEKFDAASNADLSAGYDHRYAYEADEVDAAIAELKEKLEDAKASAYAESVDAGMENRRLKRALWLARAISAINAVGEIHNVIVCMRERNPKMSLSNTEAQEQVWKNVARKCRAMAEKFK
jgi:acyl carrier protein phosphodiesterase